MERSMDDPYAVLTMRLTWRPNVEEWAVFAEENGGRLEPMDPPNEDRTLVPAISQLALIHWRMGKGYVVALTRVFTWRDIQFWRAERYWRCDKHRKAAGDGGEGVECCQVGSNMELEV